jgi:hypothetical protein
MSNQCEHNHQRRGCNTLFAQESKNGGVEQQTRPALAAFPQGHFLADGLWKKKNINGDVRNPKNPAKPFP